MMKIAIPTRDGQIDDHFGHCAYYEIIEVNENGQIASSEILDSPEGCGCKSNIANTLSQKGVRIMLAGNIGQGAMQKLTQSGIKVIRGCHGDVNSNVALFLSGNLFDNAQICEHHDCKHKEE